jgi:hypothetical protein
MFPYEEESVLIIKLLPYFSLLIHSFPRRKNDSVCLEFGRRNWVHVVSSFSPSSSEKSACRMQLFSLASPHAQHWPEVM